MNRINLVMVRQNRVLSINLKLINIKSPIHLSSTIKINKSHLCIMEKQIGFSYRTKQTSIKPMKKSKRNSKGKFKMMKTESTKNCKS